MDLTKDEVTYYFNKRIRVYDLDNVLLFDDIVRKVKKEVMMWQKGNF